MNKKIKPALKPLGDLNTNLAEIWESKSLTISSKFYNQFEQGLKE